MSTRARYMMGDTNPLEEGIKLVVFPSPVGLNDKNFSIKEPFNKVLEILKLLKHLRFMLKQIDPCEHVIVINETNIVFKTTNIITSRTPYIRKYEFQWSF
jgi:hypothetical protein